MPVVSVQNLFNLTNRSSADVLAHCEAEGIGFIPWFPVASGALTGPDTAMGSVVAETGATPTQVALAWLLHHSPVDAPDSRDQVGGPRGGELRGGDAAARPTPRWRRSTAIHEAS